MAITNGQPTSNTGVSVTSRPYGFVLSAKSPPPPPPPPHPMVRWGDIVTVIGRNAFRSPSEDYKLSGLKVYRSDGVQLTTDNSSIVRGSYLSTRGLRYTVHAGETATDVDNQYLVTTQAASAHVTHIDNVSHTRLLNLIVVTTTLFRDYIVANVYPPDAGKYDWWGEAIVTRGDGSTIAWPPCTSSIRAWRQSFEPPTYTLQIGAAADICHGPHSAIISGYTVTRSPSGHLVYIVPTFSNWTPP